MELSVEGRIWSDKETIVTHKPNETLLERRAEEVRAIITVLYISGLHRLNQFLLTNGHVMNEKKCTVHLIIDPLHLPHLAFQFLFKGKGGWGYLFKWSIHNFNRNVARITEIGRSQLDGPMLDYINKKCPCSFDIPKTQTWSLWGNTIGIGV